ncbi:hypothetical protein HDU91_006173, partial [Kappamyces sp. JEL0680]
MTANDGLGYYIDTSGDLPPELYLATPSAVTGPALKPSEQFIALEGPRKQKKGKKKKGKNPIPRKQFRKATEPDKAAAEARQHNEAVMQDYLDNADVDDLFQLQGLGALASLNMMDSSDNSSNEIALTDDEPSSDESIVLHPAHKLAEQGYYEVLMGRDDSPWESDNADSDGIPTTDLEDEDFDLREETAAIRQEVDPDSYYIDHRGNFSPRLAAELLRMPDQDDSDPQAAALPFSGGPSKWDMNPELLAYMLEEQEKEKKFLKRLNADFGSDTDQSDDWNPVPPGSSGKGKAQRRREKKEANRARRAKLAQESQTRQKQVEQLEDILGINRKTVGKELGQYLQTINRQIRRWAADVGFGDVLVLSPLPASIRRLVVVICTSYNAKCKTRGSGKKKTIVLYRTALTHVPQDWNNLVQSIATPGTKL